MHSEGTLSSAIVKVLVDFEDCLVQKKPKIRTMSNSPLHSVHTM